MVHTTLFRHQETHTQKRPLEYLLTGDALQQLPVKDARKRYRPYDDLNRNYETGARREYVAQSSLPHGVIGLYNPLTNTLLISEAYRHNSSVEAHEAQHARECVGGYNLTLMPDSESRADAAAGARTGHQLRYFGSLGFWLGN